MLDKAIIISASFHKSVILDHVPLISDLLSSHTVTKDTDTKPTNLWCYKDFKIEQQLKYVPVEILMRNVIRRNLNPENHRQMAMVLEQYSDRFVAVTHAEQEHLGTLRVVTLKKWVERCMKIDFFDINPNHRFIYNESEDIDEAVQSRMEGFVKEMKDPDHAMDPTGEIVDEENVERLKLKYEEYPTLQERIEKMTETILKNMLIFEGATEVMLTYVSSDGIRPTIIRDTSESISS